MESYSFLWYLYLRKPCKRMILSTLLRLTTSLSVSSSKDFYMHSLLKGYQPYLCVYGMREGRSSAIWERAGIGRRGSFRHPVSLPRRLSVRQSISQASACTRRCRLRGLSGRSRLLTGLLPFGLRLPRLRRACGTSLHGVLEALLEVGRV